MARAHAVEQVYGFAGGHGENTRVVGAKGETVELTATDWSVDGVFEDRMSGAEVPPADFAVFGGGGEDIVVFVPDNGFDGATVDARADFVACWVGVGLGSCGGGGGAVVAAAGEVEDAEFLFHASRG